MIRKLLSQAVSKMRINKNDRNDAIGIARIMQTGWFKEVHVKDIDSGQGARGLLKNLDLVIGRAKLNVFAVRAEELIEGRPELIAAIRPLLEARNAVEQQVSELDRPASVVLATGITDVTCSSGIAISRKHALQTLSTEPGADAPVRREVENGKELI
jgi:transposase